MYNNDIAHRQEPGASATPAGQRGFNLIELLISMSLATIVFMSVTIMYVRQGEVIQQQSDVLDMNREARFALEHLRRDLASLGSNSTPNSDYDPLVCPKPDVSLRAVTLSLKDSYAAAPELNPGVRPAAMTLFGSLDVKRRFRTTSIQGNKLFLFDDGANPLPKSQEEYDQIFAADRFVRVSGADGAQMYFHVSSSGFGDNSITLTAPVAHMGEGQVCGYAGFGQGYWVDVQNFVRYRVVADTRPGAVLLASGLPERALLVRERLKSDGITVQSQTILAENAVDFGVYDMVMDIDPKPESVKIHRFPTIYNVVSEAGDGALGNTATATPEQLRSISLKISLRSEWPDKGLAHQPRQGLFAPINTYQLSDDGRGAHHVVSVGSRVYLPTLVSRNL